MPQYRFEEITINSTEKKKPVEADKDAYLGLEHLDTSCLHVTRWGSEVAPIGDKLIMRKGDVLFGRRRAYQKKVAIAPFDGIFSAHGMVLRPRTEVITERFFPFFISSDYFLDAAINISVGSLSPTINWRDLKELTFNIPPLDEQDALADELWAFEDTKEAYNRLMTATDALVKSQFIEMFGDPRNNTYKWPLETLNGISISKLSYGSGAAAEPYDGTVRYIRITDINESGELNDDVKSPDTYEEKYELHEGDILFARSGATVGKTYCHRGGLGSCVYAGYLIRLVPDRTKVLPAYVFYYTKSDYYNEFVALNQRTVAQPNINAQQYGELQICIPPLELQNRFAAFVESTDKSKFATGRNSQKVKTASTAGSITI